MTDSTINIAGETLELSEAEISTAHGVAKSVDYLTIEILASIAGSDDGFAINGFTVADCKHISDLSGHVFVLDDEDGPNGGKAAGELMESVIEYSSDQLMFECISLAFGEFDGASIPVVMSATVFNADKTGIPVEARFLAVFRESK